MAKASPAPPPEFYFSPDGETYWLKHGDGFLKLSERNLKRHLAAAGSLEDAAFDRLVVECQRERWVAYAGPLAGHPAGVITTPAGDRVLVTSSVKVPKGRKGDCEAWLEFLEQLLPDRQCLRVVHWLQEARRALLERDHRPGPALVLAGPARCGKSFLQHLITQLLSGRHALPYRYMTDRTAFNSDLAGAEHWKIEDQHARTDTASRRLFGSKLKEFVANMDFSVHAKGRQAIALPCYRRISLSVNNERENLLIVPPVDESMKGKMHLFNCAPAKCLTGNYAADWKTFTDQLPAFAYYVDCFRAPKEWQGPSLSAAYHHPDLLECLLEMSPEAQLVEMLDEVFFKEKGLHNTVTKSATELNKELLDSGFGLQAAKLLYSPQALGSFLSRLETNQPERFRRKKIEGKTLWQIGRP